MKYGVPDFRLLEVGRVFSILEFHHDMVWEAREVLQRLYTQIVILVSIHNHSGCLRMCVGGYRISHHGNQSSWKLLII